jgi:hypothetical protein
VFGNRHQVVEVIEHDAFGHRFGTGSGTLFSC